MNVLELLTLDKIQAWAEAFPPEHTVGVSQEGVDCPVHRYLRDQHVPVAAVSRYYAHLSVDTFPTKAELPRDIFRLVGEIDNRPGTSEVTAGDVLQAIREVRK